MKNSNRVYNFKEIGEAIKNSKPIEFKKNPEKKKIEFFKNVTTKQMELAFAVIQEIKEERKLPTSIGDVNTPRGFNDSLEMDYGLNKRKKLGF